MKLTDGEKLILMMLSEIHEALKIKNGVDSKFVRSAILSGNLWGLKWGLPGIFHGSEPTPEVVTEVCEILDMWSLIERSYRGLSPEDTTLIEKEAAPLGKHVRFTGFDGNNEAEYINVAGFLVDELERFSEFKGRDLNSHMPSLDAHRRMLTVFKPMRTSSNLTATEIIAILKHRIHPESRKAAAN